MGPEGGRRADLGALGALAALVAVLFHDVVFSGRVLFERDVQTYFIPFAEILRRMARERMWPLWNPYLAFGQPLLANPQFEVLYPFTWLLALLAPWTYYTGFVVFHSLFSAVGLYLLCRTLGLGAAAAFAGAGVWVSSGPWLSLASNWLHLAGAAWMPWVLLATERLLRSRSTRSAMWLGAAAGLQLLAGSADMALLAWLASGLRLLGPVVSGAAGPRRRLLGLSALAAVIALGLAAGQWVPTSAAAAATTRGSISEADRTFWSVHPLFLLQAVVPVPFKEMSLGPVAEERLFESREPFLFSLYLGLPAAALVAAAAADRRTPWRRYALGCLALGVLGALGRYTPVYHFFTVVFPPFKLVRYPMKAMLLVALFWSVLAAAGLEACRRGGRAARVAIVVAALGGGAALALAAVCRSGPGWLGGWVDPQAAGTLAEVLAPATRRLCATAALAFALAALVAMAQRRVRLPMAALVAGCVVADLVAMHAGLNFTAPREVYSVQPASLSLLAGRPFSRVYTEDYQAPSRIPEVERAHPRSIAALDTGMPPPWVVAVAYRMYPYPTLLGSWGIEGSYDTDLQTFFPAHLALMTRLLHAVEGQPAHQRLLQLGAVDRVLSLHTQGYEGLTLRAQLPTPFRGAIHVFDVPGSVPRTYVVARARHAEGTAAVAAILADDFQMHDEVVLSLEPLAAPPRAAAAGSPAAVPAGEGGSSRIVSWRPDFIRVEADAVADGYLVLVDTYDPGWRATVDGRAAPIVRANVAFRAVALTRGRHTVDFRYRPRSVAWGLAISALTLAGLLAMRVRGRYRRPRPVGALSP
jgi:hypothetical protein